MKIRFHYTYILVALSFALCGYFINLIIFTSIILIHEIGHIIMAKLVKINVGKIVIYPYGGVLDLDIKINTPINKELLVALGGFMLQILFYIGIIFGYKLGMVREYVFELFKEYNNNIIMFNILPIYPLDGSKIVRLLFDYLLPYKVVNRLVIIISIITSVLIIGINVYKFNYTFFMIGFIIAENLRKYYDRLDYYFNLFLLERYLYKYNFKKRKIIKKIGKMQKGKYHFFNNNDSYETEKQVLERKFGINREKMFDYNKRL